MIYSDLITGKAAAFDKENYERYAILQSSTDTVVYIPAIKAQPRSLYVDDIKSNPKHFWNWCLGGYFGKTIVHLKEEEGGQ